MAVLDSGINYEHPNLKSRMWVNPKEYRNGRDDDGNGIIDDVYGAAFLPGGWVGDPMDESGHGTLVAGIIAGKTDVRANFDSISPHARLMAIKLWRNSDDPREADLLDGIAYAVSNGATVINASFSSRSSLKSEYVEDCIRSAGEKGVIVVASAGNSNEDSDEFPRFPASLPNGNIVAVMASDLDDKKTAISNFGAQTVDIAAPGDDVYTTAIMGFDSWCGASVAVPQVSGSLALIRAVAPNWTWDQAKAYLLDAADRPCALKNLSVSSGRLNIGKAISSPVSVTAPRGDVRWAAGSTQLVRWTDTFSTDQCALIDVSLQRSLPGYSYALARDVSRKAGFAAVTLPKIIAGMARIAVSCATTNIGAISQDFEIVESSD